MDQPIQIDSARVQRLAGYLDALATASSRVSFDGAALYRQHQADLDAATPHEVMVLFNDRLAAGESAAEILAYLDKAINALHRGLSHYRESRPLPGSDSFLSLLDAENEGLLKQLAAIRRLLLAGLPWEQLHPLLRDAIERLKTIDSHYQKKENILFPRLEQFHAQFNGLAIMWAMHDRARQSVKRAAADLATAQPDEQQIRVDLGQLFFALQGLVHKETLILFPITGDLMDVSEDLRLLAQCKDYPSVFLEPDDEARFAMAITAAQQVYTDDATPLPGSERFMHSPTGSLTAVEALAIFNALPVDLSFVDADNKVRYFTRPKDRLFPRSPAVIGRDVSRCHPPASVHVVEAIIAAFRAGERDQARFWIDLNGQKVLIEYFAVRDDAGQYLGVLEVSQNITTIQQLEGQQRLLDWQD